MSLIWGAGGGGEQERREERERVSMYISLLWTLA